MFIQRYWTDIFLLSKLPPVTAGVPFGGRRVWTFLWVEEPVFITQERTDISS